MAKTIANAVMPAAPCFFVFEAIGRFPIRQPAALAGNNRVSGRNQTIRSKYNQNCPRCAAEGAVCE
jgi:hypothetical protein